jgi:hypothetical protein
MKHIDVRNHYIRELISKKEIQIEYMPTEDMIADILTKGVSKSILRRLRPRLLGSETVPDLCLPTDSSVVQSRGCVGLSRIRNTK